MIKFRCRCGADLPCVTHTRATVTKRGYNNPRWRALRYAHMLSNPLCVKCLARGIVRAMKVLDHVIPVTGPDDPTFWIGPFQGLCRECDNAKTLQDRRDGMTIT